MLLASELQNPRDQPTHIRWRLESLAAYWNVVPLKVILTSSDFLLQQVPRASGQKLVSTVPSPIKAKLQCAGQPKSL